MKLFPIKKIAINSQFENSDNFTKLKASTEHSDKLITTSTDKLFIGQVTDTNFKLISSKIGIGAFAVFQFDPKENKNEINVTLNKAFKILFIVFLSLSSVGVVISIIQIGIPKGIVLLIPFLISLLMFRFVLIGIGFKISTNLGKKALSEILGLVNN